ncbi:MAG: futalosine hydrolase [Actinomycetia bacterium]|nr:futalosine hydrolase [Actinomycetes bacterium]
MRILVVTAVAAERDAVVAGRADFAPVRGLPYGAVSDGRVVVAAGGVGPVAAAVATARLIALGQFALVISAGIGGAFDGRAVIGDVVAATESRFADLGADTDEGFLHVTDLGFPGGAPLRAATVDLPLTGPVLTLATMTGTETAAAALCAAHPDALAEAMEGYGVAWAATEHGLPWAEVRAVSNLIGRREKSMWDIPRAFAALGKAMDVVTR